MIEEIVDGVWLDPWSVTMVKKIDDSKCSLWLTGQSALEGHVLDYPAEEVVQAINDLREEDEGETDEDEPDEDEDAEEDE